MKLFYSWQNDLDNKVNRNFIKSSLEGVITSINKNLFIDEPERQAQLDHDTNNVPGLPDIVSTILGKISNCTVFIADVSFISVGGTKQIPNPNVMFELGYAISKLGSDRIICVMNTAFGNPDSLPFDLRQRRYPIQYNLSRSNDENKASIKKELIKNLTLAIQPILQLNKYRYHSLNLSANPTSDEIFDAIIASDSKNDWVSVVSNEREIHYFKKNVNLRFEIDSSERGIQNNQFQEPWANRHPDPDAASYWCMLYYCSTHIDTFSLVSVDGGRARLPLPKNRDELTVTLLRYKVAQIHDTKGTLDEYMRRSKLSVENS